MTMSQFSGAFLLLFTLAAQSINAVPSPDEAWKGYNASCQPKTLPAKTVYYDEAQIEIYNDSTLAEPHVGYYSNAMPLTGDQCGLYGVIVPSYYYKQSIPGSSNNFNIGPSSVSYYAYFDTYQGFYRAYETFNNDTFIDDQWITQSSTPITVLDRTGFLTYMMISSDMPDIIIRETLQSEWTYLKGANRMWSELVLDNTTTTTDPSKYKYITRSWLTELPPPAPSPFATPTRTYRGKPGSSPGAAQVTVEVKLPYLFATMYVNIDFIAGGAGSPGVVRVIYTTNDTYPIEITGPSLPKWTKMNYTTIDDTAGNINFINATAFCPLTNQTVVTTFNIKAADVQAVVTYPQPPSPPPAPPVVLSPPAVGTDAPPTLSTVPPPKAEGDGSSAVMKLVGALSAVMAFCALLQ